MLLVQFNLLLLPIVIFSSTSVPQTNIDKYATLELESKTLIFLEKYSTFSHNIGSIIIKNYKFVTLVNFQPVNIPVGI